MKRIITILFLLFTAAAYGQRITDNNTRVGFLELRANGWFHLPEDTVLSPSINANPCQQVAKKNGIVYTYDCILHKWVPIVSNATVVDSGRISNDTLYLHKNTGGEIAIKLGFYTTSQSDARFLQKVDTASLSNRINAKVNVSDTANMLSKYLRKGDTVSLSNRINLAIPLSQKGAINGVAPIGSDGKVPAAYLPSGAQVYKGTWDASTNTPTLVDGTGTAGWTYRVTVGGTRNLGSGNITFAAGDDVIYNGTIWQRNPNGATVTSVNGQQGAVVLATDDVAEGATNKYFTSARVNAAETDPSVPANVKAITATNISNWNTAFGWGNHASAGYLTATTGDARYPVLTGSYSNPSWLTSLPWSKITGAPAFITGNQTITLTGDITGTGTTGIATTLRNIGTAGTYTKVITDAQGRVTSGTGIDTADIPSFSTKVRPLLSGSGPITFGSTTGVIGWNGTTTNVPEGTNLYWTNARGDARYPLLSGSYPNPSWLASLPWSKITGTPTTLAGYGITDAAPGSGSGNYIQNQVSAAQSGAGFWSAGPGIANRFVAVNPVASSSGDLLMYEGSSIASTNIRWRWIRSTGEAAGNVGNNLLLQSFDNTGNIISTPFSITRSTGVAAFSQIPTAGGNPVFTQANHPTGIATNNTLSGATVFATLNFNSAGHYTGATTRSLTPADIGAAPAAASSNYIQNGTALQTTSNFYISGNGRIGTNLIVDGAASITGASTHTGLGSFVSGISLTGGTSNLLNFNSVGSASPAFTTRSAGTKIALWGTVDATHAGYNIGMQGNGIWLNLDQNSASNALSIYGGTTLVSSLDGLGSQQWNGSARFKGWGGPANSGPAAEVGVPGGYVIFAGIDRTSTATYYPTTLRGGSGTADPNGKDFTIDAAGYKFSALLNATSIGTNAGGYLVNTTANFIQNQIGADQSANLRISGIGIADAFGTTAVTGTADITIHTNTGYGDGSANRRWSLFKSTTEAAGNVGNDFNIGRYDNSGSYLGSPLTIARSTGVVTMPSGVITQSVSSPTSTDLLFNVAAGGDAFRFNVGGSEKVTISTDGILSIGNSSPSTGRSSPLQVQGNIWATDAYILGTGTAPIGEFGLSGSADVFVRTMGTGNVLFQTSAGTVRATVNGTTGNFEVTNQLKISGGSPGAGKVLTSDGAGLATWSAGNVKAVRVITASYTATVDDYTIINRATTGTPVLTLPAASANTGREYVIVDEAANVTSNGLAFSPGVVFRGTSYTSWVNAALSATTRITVQSDGTNWIITSQP